MRIKLLAPTFLSCFVLAFAQDNRLPQRRQVVLDHPEVIQLRLSPVTRRRSAGVYEKELGPFVGHSKVRFVLSAINTSTIALDVRSWDTVAQNRPRLLRDNQEVPYREGISDLIEKKENSNDIVSLVVIRLEPNMEKTLETIDLSTWYPPLEPGHYVFSTQHRFVQGGKWVDSDLIGFEVQVENRQKN